jgi:hypothetical protein
MFECLFSILIARDSSSDLSPVEWISFLKTFLRDIAFGLIPIYLHILDDAIILNQDRVSSWFDMEWLLPLPDVGGRRAKMTSTTFAYEVGGMSESNAWDIVGKQNLRSWFCVHEIPYLVRDRITAWHLYRGLSIPIEESESFRNAFSDVDQFPSYLTALRSIFTNFSEFLLRSSKLAREQYLLK